MDLSWDHFISGTVDHKSQQLGYVSVQENLTAHFQKAQLTPYKSAHAFSLLLPSQGIMSTKLVPVIAFRIEPRCTHFR